jgi:hypothetical protein
MSASDPKAEVEHHNLLLCTSPPPSVSRLLIINHVLTPTIVEINSLRTADTGPA